MSSPEWKPIETAPYERAFLVFVPPACIAVARYVGIDSLFIDESFGYNEDGQIFGATHWMELPEAPDVKP